VLLESESSARARGVRPLARLVGYEQERGSRAGASRIWSAPEEPASARVVLTRRDPALERLIDESPWAGVERHVVEEHTGFFEAIGGVALAAGAALVARGLRSVLVVGGDASVRYLTRWERFA
jgi:hypothetical protein